MNNCRKVQERASKIRNIPACFRVWLFILSTWLLCFSCNSGQKEIIGDNEFYVCSMDPQVMEKQPGPCPICGMPLSKTVINKTEMYLLKLSNEQINLANIKTDTVKMGSIGNERTLTGIFTVNQTLQQQVSSRFNGRIDKLYFKLPGQEIKEGDLIYEVYSRDLMLAEEEYLFAIDKSKMLSENNTIIESAKNKLLLWGLTEVQIKNLEAEKEAKIVNPIYSKASGTITEIQYKEGDYINEGSTIFKLTDLTELWVEAQVYSNELDLINEGDRLEITPEAFPEEVIEGEVDFTNPELQSQTKINLIRIKIPNKRKQLIPGMMAFVHLKSKSKAAITLPMGAIIQNGQKVHVWIQNRDRSFEAKQVSIGMQTKTKAEIISGIKMGDVVVVSGAYLLYSDYVFKTGMYPLTNDSSSAKKESMPGMKM